ncbi:hypothetical protein Tco_0817281 [Tanacetum coccineum]
MYKEFNAFNKLESRRFDNLQEQLSKDLRLMFKDMFSLLEAAEVFKKANVKGEKGHHCSYFSGGKLSTQVIPNAEQAPPVNKEKALVLHTSEEKSLGEKDTDDEPSAKNLKFVIPTSSAIPSPIPLKSIMPKLFQKPDANKMTMDQFTEHLFIHLLSFSSKRANSSQR